jgi:hypothetical protein
LTCFAMSDPPPAAVMADPKVIKEQIELIRKIRKADNHYQVLLVRFHSTAEVHNPARC